MGVEIGAYGKKPADLVERDIESVRKIVKKLGGRMPDRDFDSAF